LGVDARGAEVVDAGTHVLVRIEPGPVAARVTGDGILAPFAGDLDAEVRLVAALHAAGAPVIPPLAGVPARVHEHGGRRVTLWEWWERPDGDGTPEAAGRSLAACHRALTGVEVPLRPWAKLEEARRALPRLAPADRALLAAHLEPPDGPLRPIHATPMPGTCSRVPRGTTGRTRSSAGWSGTLRASSHRAACWAWTSATARRSWPPQRARVIGT
jgi:hypothetical protein